METLLSCREIWCHRENWRGEDKASRVCGVSAAFASGELCGFVGEDGCGKGLLLNVLGMIETPDRGELVLPGGGESLPRERLFGYMFSYGGLLPGLSVCENVAVPLFRKLGVEPDEARDATLDALRLCGCEGLSPRLAESLHPSEQALVALARALAHRPRIVIAIVPKAEPALVAIAARAAMERGACVLWAGPRRAIDALAPRVIEMREGKIVQDSAA